MSLRLASTVKNISYTDSRDINLLQLYGEYYVSKNTEYGEDILNEISILKLLHRVPYIIQFVETWIDKSKIYIGMQYMDSDLYHWAKSVSHSRLLSEIKPIIIQVCTGLSYLHNLNIGHFDLKPSNILCSSTAEGMKYKLCDFQRSVSVHIAQASTSIYMGTYAYQPPEVLHGERPDMKTDIWSLGISILTLLDSQQYYSRDISPGNTQDLYDIWDTAHIWTYKEFVKQVNDKTITGNVDFYANTPEFQIINSMVSMNPTERPSIKQILKVYNRPSESIKQFYCPCIDISLELANELWRYMCTFDLPESKNRILLLRKIIAIELASRYLSSVKRLYMDENEKCILAHICIDYTILGDSEGLIHGKHARPSPDAYLNFLSKVDYIIYNPCIDVALKNGMKYTGEDYIFTSERFDKWFI